MTKKFIEDNDLRRSDDRTEAKMLDALQHGEPIWNINSKHDKGKSIKIEQEDKEKEIHLVIALEQRIKELKDGKSNEHWSEDRDVRRQILYRKAWR